jgi:type I restriction enzyme S subunit
MNAERLLALYERVAEAPDAIARLRRFILDLAVRGKLVPQDPQDEPASELLKRIAKEKARLVKAGEIRKPKPSEPISDDGLPIKLPTRWAWARLCEIGNLSGGMTPSMNHSDFWGGEIVWLSPKDIKSDEVADSELKISALGLAETRLELFRPGCLFMVARSGILKRTFPVAINRVPAAANQDMKVLSPFLKDQERYLQIMFRGLTGFLLRELVKTGTTVQSLKYSEFEQQPFPLPPLAEQHRIVAKVDELMALCDQLEAARQEREARRDRLAAASLARLNAPDPETFQSDARFTLNALPALTTRPNQIKQLRQTILNLAVRGKLVAQDPNEEPASELLKQLKKARAALEAEGKIRKDKGEPPSHYGGEQGFDLPHSWLWARLTEIGQTQTGTSPSSANADLFGNFIPFVKPADLDGNLINYDGPGLSEIGISHSRIAAENSILMVCIGATLGKVNTTSRPVCFNQQINSLTPFLDGLTAFIAIALKASDFQSLAWSKAGTGTLPIISKGKWEVLPIPLPPIAEQHRIVAKVEKLMALCNRLEASLTTSDQTRTRLLEATLAEALAPASISEMEAAE